VRRLHRDWNEMMTSSSNRYTRAAVPALTLHTIDCVAVDIRCVSSIRYSATQTRFQLVTAHSALLLI
jgi:hypothetical protein